VPMLTDCVARENSGWYFLYLLVFFFGPWYWNPEAYRLFFLNYVKWKLFQYDKHPNQVRNLIPAQHHAEVSRTL
jgi:hypothetical protein